jgi:hypothetical protein
LTVSVFSGCSSTISTYTIRYYKIVIYTLDSLLKGQFINFRHYNAYRKALFNGQTLIEGDLLIVSHDWRLEEGQFYLTEVGLWLEIDHSFIDCYNGIKVIQTVSKTDVT